MLDPSECSVNVGLWTWERNQGVWPPHPLPRDRVPCLVPCDQPRLIGARRCMWPKSSHWMRCPQLMTWPVAKRWGDSIRFCLSRRRIITYQETYTQQQALNYKVTIVSGAGEAMVESACWTVRTRDYGEDRKKNMEQTARENQIYHDRGDGETPSPKLPQFSLLSASKSCPLSWRDGLK